MKRNVFRLASIMMIALAGVCASGCAPMVYDSNPHFSHHRVPPRPMPQPIPPGRPVYIKPAPGKPVVQPGPNKPGQNKPGQQPGPANPNNPGRPGTNNHR